jgi:hypothetical protein
MQVERRWRGATLVSSHSRFVPGRINRRGYSDGTIRTGGVLGIGDAGLGPGIQKMKSL